MSKSAFTKAAFCYQDNRKAGRNMLDFSNRVKAIKKSDAGEILKLTAQPDIISFAGGLPAEELFPLTAVKEIAAKMLSEEGKKALQYGPSLGYMPLRKQIAARMNEKLHTRVTGENILITNGSQQGLDIMARLFCNKDDVVIVEKPTYLGAISAFNLSEVNYLEVESDAEGMNLTELEKALQSCDRVKMIYVISDFQNPTGMTWSLQRRKDFLKLVSRYQIPVVEDNPYGELRFKGEFLPSLQSLDEDGLVILLGTFSKTFAPGFRIGWISATEEIIEKCDLLKQGIDLASASSAQRIVSYFIDNVDFDKHVDSVRQTYAKRCDAMLAAMDKYFPDRIHFTRPEGGLFCWVTLPEQVNARKVLSECIEQKVAFVPGDAFFVSEGHHHYMRLNYSCADERQIEEGIKRIAHVLAQYV